MKHLLAVSFVIALSACGPGQQDPPAGGQPSGQQPNAQPGGQQPAGLTVLVPLSLASQEATTTGDLTVEPTHYTVAQQRDDLVFSLTGTTLSREESTTEPTVPRGTPAGDVRGVPVYVTENEGIRTATWTENGTAFALDIECTSTADERCTSTDYIMNAVRALVRRTP